jgi:RNA recognition motif-containing protein
MNKTMFVGNLPYSLTSEELGTLFAEAGNVVSANVVISKMTGRPAGFGFVEMSSVEEMHKAIEMLNGREVGGRALNVSEKRAKAE